MSERYQGRFSEQGTLRRMRPWMVKPMKTDKRHRIEVVVYSVIFFVLGLSVGAFIAASYAASHVREVLGR